MPIILVHRRTQGWFTHARGDAKTDVLASLTIRFLSLCPLCLCVLCGLARSISFDPTEFKHHHADVERFAIALATSSS